MNESELTSLVKSELVAAIGKPGDVWSQARNSAYEYYLGQPRGDEQEGRSQVVSRDIADVVEGVMPSLVKVFASGDKVFEFEPNGPEDVEYAQQATDYINFLFLRRNDGFRVIYDFAKDGLLSRLGVGKVWWEKVPKVSVHTYVGLTEDQLASILQDDEVEPVEHSEYVVDGIPVHDLKVRRVKKMGCMKVAVLPSEEFRADKFATDLKENYRFLCHRVKRHKGELKAQGYDESVVDSGDASDEIDYSSERITRMEHVISPSPDTNKDYAWVSECYYRVDYDGDGLPELRKIVLIGDKVVENEEVEDHPFFCWSPIPIPHTLVGLSIYDIHRDIQDVKTVLFRNLLDNAYTCNQPSIAIVEGQVNVEDAMSREVGRILRVRQRGAVEPIVIPSQVGSLLNTIEYVDTARDNRGPQTRMNQGLDPNSLNKTATGVSAIMNAAQMRIDLIARSMAEGLKDCARKMLRMVVEYQSAPDIFRLRNQFIPVDPKVWNSDMDVNIAVGLGTGSKDQVLAHLNMLAQFQLQAIQAQGGAQGPLVTLENVYNLMSEFVKNTGLGNVKSLFTDPSTAAPPEPEGPSPEEQAMQAEMQMKQADLSIKQQKADQNYEINMARVQQKAHTDAVKAGLDVAGMMGGPNG